MVKRINTRLEALEARLKRSSRRICKLCGKECTGGMLVFEEHADDGTVVYEWQRPCPGCMELARQMGQLTRVVVCHQGCWCEGDRAKAEAAPKVALAEADDETFEKYASGAAKYSRSLQESRGA
jgi:hypothetical protein